MTQGRDIITRRIFYRNYDRSKIEINVTISRERKIFGQKTQEIDLIAVLTRRGET